MGISGDRFVSARGARRMLVLAGVGPTAARRALEAGLAGEPIETSGAHLYEAERVRELAARESIPAERLPPADELVMVRRVPVEQAGRRDGWWTLPGCGLVARALLGCLVEKHGSVPVVITMAGFVIGGADAVGVSPVDTTTVRLETQRAGDWFDDFDRRTLYSPRGHCWWLWHANAA